MIFKIKASLAGDTVVFVLEAEGPKAALAAARKEAQSIFGTTGIDRSPSVTVTLIPEKED